MNTPPIVSVLIPVYNPGEALLPAIRSIFAQTLQDWELILVDDGSTDGTRARLDQLDDPRVRVLPHGPNRGVGYRRNQLVEAARGRYLATMDSDDVMLPTRLERQVAAFEADPSLELLATAAYLLGAEGEPLGAVHEEPLDTRPHRVVRAGWVIHPTIMTRREWSLAHLYDPNQLRAEDHELWTRSGLTCHAARLPEPLVAYRIDTPGTLRAHVRGWYESMRIYRRNAPARVGWGWTLAYLAATLGLILKGQLRLALGQDGGVVGRRRRVLPEAEAAALRAQLEAIGAQQVSGWDP